ncbi:MAG: hypothetical protein ACI4LN_03625 [Anaerovoracaceae bacterium]
MKKKLFCTALIFVLLLTAAVSAYAETGIQPRDTDSVTFVTTRTSRTSANVSVYVSFTEQVDRYNVIIYLQKKENGEWVNDWQNEEYVFFNNGSQKETFLFSNAYTHLSEGVIYRIKCVSKDYIGDSTFTTTTCSNQF